MTKPLVTRRASLGGLWFLATLTGAEAATPFAVVLHKDDRETIAGHVTLDDHARMKVVSVKPDRSDWLHRLVQRMNATEVMHADVPPREGVPTFTSASRIIRRNDPDFVPAMKNYIRTYYGAELRPERG